MNCSNSFCHRNVVTTSTTIKCIDFRVPTERPQRVKGTLHDNCPTRKRNFPNMMAAK